MMVKNLTVLTVDDDIINLTLVEKILNKVSSIDAVYSAKNGAEAITILKTRDDIDVILLDLLMPVMGGIETIKVLRADASMRQIPIIVLTTDETKKAEALQSGANLFMVKPMREKDILLNIKELVA